MIGLNVKIDDAALRGMIAEIESRAGDLKPAMERIGAYIAFKGGGLSFAADRDSVAVRTPVISPRRERPRKNEKSGPSLRSLRLAPIRPLPVIGGGDMDFFAELIRQHILSSGKG